MFAHQHGFWVCVVAERQPRNKPKAKLVLYAHGKEEYLFIPIISTVFFNTLFGHPPTPSLQASYYEARNEARMIRKKQKGKLPTFDSDVGSDGR